MPMVSIFRTFLKPTTLADLAIAAKFTFYLPRIGDVGESTGV